MANFLNPLNPTNFGMNVTGNFNNLASSGTFRLPSDKVSSSGPKLSIQLSDGNGTFIHDPKIKVTQQTEFSGTPLQDPISRLVLDASDSVNAPEPSSRLRFIPPSGGIFAQSVQPQNGDVAYFNDGFTGLDLRLYNGTNWLSLTDAGAAPSTAAGPQYAVQFNATGVGGALGGTSDFIFDDSGVNNNLTIISELNLTTPSGTLTYDSSGLGVNITSPGSGISMASVSGDISLLTQSGNVSITSTSSGTQPKSVSLVSGNSNAEFVSYSSTRESWVQLSNPISTPYTVQSSWKTSGLLIAADSGNSGYTTGSGVGLYLESEVDAAAPTILSQRATFELRSRNSSVIPFTPISRVYMQAPSQQFNSGYRVLFSRGNTTSTGPTPDNLGNGDILKSGEFYIGENRAQSGAPTINRPHINYNLAGGATPSGFGTFNICNSTLAISDDTEIPKFVAMRNTSQPDGQITVGDGISDRVDIRGGIPGINNADVGMITMNGSSTTSGGGEFRAKSTSTSNVSSVLTTAAGNNGEGQLYLYSGAAAPTSANHTLLASGASGGSLALGTSSVAPTITMTGNNGESVFGGDMEVKQEISLTITGSQQTALTLIPDNVNANRAFSLSTRQAGTEYGSDIDFKGNIGSSGSEQSGIRFSPYGNVATNGFSLANLGAAGEGCSMILDANLQGGQQAGQGGGLYLGWNETTIFNNNSWPGLKTRNYNGVRPCLLVNGPTLFAQDSSSRLFSWDHGSSQEEQVWIGYGTGNAGLTVAGSLSKTTGSFKIDHPDPEKKDTHNLYHSFVESPTGGDNLYRYRVETEDKKAVIDLPDYFQHLNIDEMTWVSPVASFGRGYAVVSAGQTRVDVIVDEEGTYNVLLIATRKDRDAVQNWKGVEREKR